MQKLFLVVKMSDQGMHTSVTEARLWLEKTSTDAQLFASFYTIPKIFEKLYFISSHYHFRGKELSLPNLETPKNVFFCKRRSYFTNFLSYKLYRVNSRYVGSILIFFSRAPLVLEIILAKSIVEGAIHNCVTQIIPRPFFNTELYYILILIDFKNTLLMPRPS